MKPRNTIKTLVRTPVRTLLVFVLLAAASFACLSRAGEYYITSREIDRLADQYVSTGYLEAIHPGEMIYDVHGSYYNETSFSSASMEEAVRILESAGQTAYVDVSRAVSGYAGDIYAPLSDGVLNAFPSNITYAKITVAGKSCAKDNPYSHRVHGRIEEIYAGLPNVAEIDATVPLYVMPQQPTDTEEEYAEAVQTIYDKFEEKQTYLVALNTYMTLERPVGKPDVRDTGQYLTAGGFYVKYHFNLVSLDGGELFCYPVDEDFSLEDSFWDETYTVDGISLRRRLETWEHNIHTLRFDTCGDLLTEPAFVSGECYMVEGRPITREDEENASPVCVILQEFAALRGISVGDTIGIRMEDLTMVGSSYAPEDYPWEEQDSRQLELTVVGIYGSESEETGVNFSYLPDSCITQEWENPVFRARDISFVLHSPQEEDAFRETVAAPLEKLGFSVSFGDSGWEEMAPSLRTIRQSSLAGFLAMAAAAGLALVLVEYLFIGRKKREFAIMRALGTPRRAAGGSLLLSLVCLSVPAITCGAAGAWYAARKAAADAFAQVGAVLPEGFAFETSLSPLWMTAVGVIVFALLCLLAWIGLRRLGRLAPLQLLQSDDAVKQKKDKKKTAAHKKSDSSAGNEEVLTGFREEFFPDLSQPLKKGSRTSGTVRFLRRHMFRRPVKTVLCVLMAALLSGAVCEMAYLMEDNRVRIDEIYDTTSVAGAVLSKNSAYGESAVPELAVRSVTDSGYVLDTYLESPGARSYYPDGLGSRNSVFLSLSYSVTNTEKLAASLGDTISIEYGEGFGPELFVQKELLAVVSRQLAEDYGIRVGDTIGIFISNRDLEYTVAGIFEWESNPETLSILTPGQALAGVRYSHVEFTLDPSLNRDLEGFYEQMNYAFDQAVSAGMKGMHFELDDSELTGVVEPLEQTLKLLELLYPFAVAAMVILAAFLPALIIFQSAKEAAILRVLGTGRGQTGRLLAGEQTILCLAGLAVGILVLYGIHGDLLLSMAGRHIWLCMAGYFAACLAGAIFAAVRVTRRQVLDLLQIRE